MIITKIGLFFFLLGEAISQPYPGSASSIRGAKGASYHRHRDLGVFSQCSQEGFLQDAGADLGCRSVTDLTAQLGDYFNFNTTGIDGKDSAEVQRILKDVFTPIQHIVQGFVTEHNDDVLAHKLDFGDYTKSEPNVCLGDFKGEDMFTGAVSTYMGDNKCNYLPLKKDAEWSVLGFTFNIPPLTGTCFNEDPDQLTGCLAISTCENEGWPSVAFGFSGGLAACVLNTVATAPSAGISTVVAEVAEATLDFYGAGISLSNAFEVDIVLYDGTQNLRDYTATPTIFDHAKFVLSPAKFDLPDVFDIFELAFHQTRGLSILSPNTGEAPSKEEMDASLAKYDASSGETGEVADLTDVLVKEWTVQGVMKGDLQGSFYFSQLPVIGPILPDAPNLNFGTGNAFFSTGRVVETSGTETAAGVYLFAGSDDGSHVIKLMAKFLLDIAGTFLDLLPNWIPCDGECASASLKKAVDKWDPSSTGGGSGTDASAAVGVTVNEDRTAIFIRVPLLIADIGTFSLNCYTNYKKFDCDVNVDGNIVAVFEAIQEGAKWIIKEVGKAGKTIAVALDKFGDDVESLFSKKNLALAMGEIGDAFEDGAEDLLDLLTLDASELEDIQAALSHAIIILEPAETLGKLAVEGVQELAEWGSGLVDEAEEIVKDAEILFDKIAGEVEKAFDCSVGAIAAVFEGDKAKCSPFSHVEDILDKVGNDVSKAFKDAWTEISDFAEEFAENFYSARSSYHYENTGETDVNNCPRVRVFKVKTVKVFGIKVSEKRTDRGISSDSNCLKERLSKAAEAKSLWQDVVTAKLMLTKSQKENADSLAGKTLELSTLVTEGFNCTSQWLRSQAEGNSVPLRTECSTVVIATSGLFSSETVSVSLQELLDTTDNAQVKAASERLLRTAQAQLAAKIAPTMNTEPVDCTPTAKWAGQIIDSNCDGVVNNELCNYSDQDTEGKVLKDCKCQPPKILERGAFEVTKMLEAVTVGCDADMSPTTLGRPVPYTDEGCGLGGSFMPEIDVPFTEIDEPVSNANDPAKNCGAGKITRRHQYRDDLSQESNVMYQTITITGAPPTINTDLIKETVKMDCALPVTEGLFAPLAPADVDIGDSLCASDLSEGYKDLSIDFVGCPDNAQSGRDKGWNVVREFFVEDGCGQKATYHQTVVREDEAAPSFSSVPAVHVMSCRAGTEPLSTGYPIAEDNCDPNDELNPDWTKPNGSRGGRITYDDDGQSVGCPLDFARTFVAKDRVCNEASHRHTVQAFSYDFQNKGSTDTKYDDKTLLPTFVYGKGGEQHFSGDTLHFLNNDGSSSTEGPNICSVRSVSYLNPTLHDAEWISVPPNQSVSVFTIHRYTNHLSINTDIVGVDVRPYFEEIVTDHGDLFRLEISCGFDHH